jgi:hypothetical protein
MRKPNTGPPADLDEALNPHRAEDQAHARERATAVLEARGVRLNGDEKDEELADLWSAVDRFESVVEARGADTMTNTPESTDPDDPALVLPERRAGESAAEYTGRILNAARRLTSFER